LRVVVWATDARISRNSASEKISELNRPTTGILGGFHAVDSLWLPIGRVNRPVRSRRRHVVPIDNTFWIAFF
jgi:hypothetical protein